MQNLQAAADTIQQQLDEANALSMTLHMYGHSGIIVEDGTTDGAIITNQMVANYNNAIDTVLNTQYYTAQDLFMQEHQNAIAGLHNSINDLVAATAVLATVSAVSDMAASADTVQEQLQVQAALGSMDMTIDQADVNNYNAALGAVEGYANSAAAFLTAANNGFMTGAVDNFAQNRNLNLANYTSATYSVDTMLIMIEGGYAVGFSGFNNIMSAEDVYANAGIYGNM